jgi:hypothetical protein
MYLQHHIAHPSARRSGQTASLYAHLIPSVTLLFCAILWLATVRREGRASCQALSYPVVTVRQCHLSEGCETPELRYLVEH